LPVILHKLIWRFLKHKDDLGFYRIQAADTVRWLDGQGVELGTGTRVIDLGCGHGIIGGELLKRGCRVTFADESNWLLPEYGDREFRAFDIEKDDIASLGTYDLVICSNVLEHLSRPEAFIDSVDSILEPGGRMYLSWTNWLSPWGGHEYSPFHYLGRSRGHLVYDRIMGRPRKHTPYVNLFPTGIGSTLEMIGRNRNLDVLQVVPRYYPELAFLTRIPVLREFLTWNCVILAQRVSRPDRAARDA
jgi:SAM-dependent methyltransferase